MAEIKKYLHTLDIGNNKIINLLLNPLTTAERATKKISLLLLTGVEGYVCYDTDENVLYFWDVGIQDWVASGGGGTIPNLQQVTNIGSNTTNNILVGNVSTNLYSALYNTGELALSNGAAESILKNTNVGSNSGISLNFPDPPSAGDYIIPISVNGVFSGTDGNITLSIPTVTPSNVTAASNKIGLGGTPTGAALQAFSIDVNEANLSLNNIGGTLGISKGGTNLTALGTANQLIRVNSGATALEYFTPTYLTTAVTSVGLSMPSAFSVSSSPITTSGTIAVTGAGTTSQYIRGDGTLATYNSGTGGGGASVSFYLNGSVDQTPTIGGLTYKQMSKTPFIGAGTDFTINANGYIQSFITDSGSPNQLLIPAGNWNFEMWFSASSGGGSPQFYVDVCKFDGTTLTTIATSSATPEGITNGTAIDLYTTAVAVPSYVLLATDRIAIRVYVIHSSKTIKLYTEDSHLCQVITTFSTGITALNGLTDQVQYFATPGTTGTSPNWSSVSPNHTLNIPLASTASVTAGLISKTDYDTFNGKQASSTNLTSLAGLAYASASFVKMTAAGTFTLDTNTYSTAIGANPSASIGLTAVNGSSTNFMRADGAPALSQSIAPTWTGLHTFSQSFAASSGTTTTNSLIVSPTINNTGTYSGIARGIYYNPTLTSVTGTTHRAFENTTGYIFLNTNLNSTRIGTSTILFQGSLHDPKLAVVGGSGTNRALVHATDNTSGTVYNSLFSGFTSGFTNAISLGYTSGTDGNISAGNNFCYFSTARNGYFSFSTLTSGGTVTSNMNSFATNLYFQASGSALNYTSHAIGYRSAVQLTDPTSLGITVATLSDFYVSDVALSGGTGTVTNRYGLNLALTNANTTNAWGVYQSNANVKNYFNGSVGLGTTAISASAILDISSTTKGFLPPRMTNANRTAISSPAVGLIVYCTDATEGLYINKSTGWVLLL